MQIFQSYDSYCFIYNSVKYVKNFLIVKQGSTNISIHNAYDVSFQLLGSTHFSQITIDGLSYNSQTTLMSALSTLLFSKQVIDIAGVASSLTGFTDTYTTGGTYSNGTLLFINNTGGTYSVTGIPIPQNLQEVTEIGKITITDLYGQAFTDLTSAINWFSNYYDSDAPTDISFKNGVFKLTLNPNSSVANSDNFCSGIINQGNIKFEDPFGLINNFGNRAFYSNTENNIIGKANFGNFCFMGAEPPIKNTIAQIVSCGNYFANYYIGKIEIGRFGTDGTQNLPEDIFRGSSLIWINTPYDNKFIDAGNPDADLLNAVKNMNNPDSLVNYEGIEISKTTNPIIVRNPSDANQFTKIFTDANGNTGVYIFDLGISPEPLTSILPSAIVFNDILGTAKSITVYVENGNYNGIYTTNNQGISNNLIFESGEIQTGQIESNWKLPLINGNNLVASTSQLSTKLFFSGDSFEQTTFTIPIGQTMSDTNYVVSYPFAQNVISLVNWMVANKTTTTFDIISNSLITGQIAIEMTITP